MLRLALTLALALAPLATARAAETSPFTRDLMRYLGLDPAKRLPELEKGAVVHNGVSDQEKLPDEIAAAGAMLLVRGKPPDAVVAAFLHAETFLEVHQVKRYQALQADAGDAPAFADLPLPDPGKLAELLKAPRRIWNLSIAEGEWLARLDGAGPNLAARVRTTLGEILAARLRAYAAQGLAGVEPYVREKGQIVDPRVGLRSALASLAFTREPFPGFLDELTAPNAPRNYYWMERSVDREKVLVLSAELRRRAGDSALGADVHFYASREYNAMLTLVGVIPYADASLVFAVNHTFTDQVTGMGSSLRRSIARNIVATGLARQLEETRKRLAR
jgi:hypothetical protein